MLIFVLYLLFAITYASVANPPEVCFDNGKCYSFYAHNASTATRAYYETIIKSNPLIGFYSKIVGEGYGPKGQAALLSHYLTDFTILVDYVAGAFEYTINAELRRTQGVNVNSSFFNPISIVSSGIHALRSDKFSRSYTPNTVFRGEDNYPGAPCTWNGSTGITYLNETEVIWGFTSTSTSFWFAQDWPHAVGSPRVLVIDLDNSTAGGGAYVYPEGTPWQYEVTLPVGMRMHQLACENTVINNMDGVPTNVSLLYMTDITVRKLPSALERMKILKRLRVAVRDGQQTCAPWQCTSRCASYGAVNNKVAPYACSCSGAKPNSDQNKLLFPSKCMKTASQIFTLQILEWQNLCVVSNASSVYLDHCVFNASDSKQQWQFTPNGIRSVLSGNCLIIKPQPKSNDYDLLLDTCGGANNGLGVVATVMTEHLSSAQNMLSWQMNSSVSLTGAGPHFLPGPPGTAVRATLSAPNAPSYEIISKSFRIIPADGVKVPAHP